jgi:hypothetical protein
MSYGGAEERSKYGATREHQGNRPLTDGREEDMRLAYAIKYVADMDKAVAFHRDTLA